MNKVFKVTVTDDKDELHLDYISLEDLEIDEVDWFFLTIDDRKMALLRKMWEYRDFDYYKEIEYELA